MDHLTTSTQPVPTRMSMMPEMEWLNQLLQHLLMKPIALVWLNKVVLIKQINSNNTLGVYLGNATE